jgi:hypothetical protein
VSTMKNRSFSIFAAAMWLLPGLTSAGTDVRVSDPTHSGHQAESSIARSPSGLLCASWNDEGNPGSNKQSYGYSSDNGATWHPSALPTKIDTVCTGIEEEMVCIDVSRINRGDPDTDYRLYDQKFYITGMERHGVGTQNRTGIAVRSTSNCQIDENSPDELIFSSSQDDGDKPMTAINNWTGSPQFGRIYVAFRYSLPHRALALKWSDNGTVWSPGSSDLSLVLEPYPAGYDVMAGVHGPWPTVAPNGDLYVAWVRWRNDVSCNDLPGGCYGRGPIDIEVSHASPTSNNMSAFTMLASPLTNGKNPHDPASPCDPPSVAQIALVPSPQIEADEAGNLHLVYVRGNYENQADHSNVFYRKWSAATGSWGSELRLNTDSGTAEQFMPSLIVNKNGAVVVYWYDTRNSENGSAHIYKRISRNRGLTWGTNVLVSDQPALLSGVSCRALGDYNAATGDSGGEYMIWGSTRNSSSDADVWFDKAAYGTPLCAVSLCRSAGFRCNLTGIVGTCCTYSLMEDESCAGADPVPMNACGCF